MTLIYKKKHLGPFFNDFDFLNKNGNFKVMLAKNKWIGGDDVSVVKSRVGEVVQGLSKAKQEVFLTHTTNNLIWKKCLNSTFWRNC